MSFYNVRVTSLQSITDTVISCRKCPRLVAWREKVAREKAPAFRDQEYWGRPVPSFGDAKARILICGLAPAAHGGNRTGRVFTGDRSGDWLFAALYRAGLANQPTSKHRGDGLKVKNCLIAACVRCAPPGNMPTLKERNTCLAYLLDEMKLVTRVRVIVCLGAFAWEGVLRVLRLLGHEVDRKPKFSHGAEARIGPYHLLGSYHPSQQNTFTGRLTRPMFDRIFRRAKAIASQ